jgi:Voltage gated chloride channel
VNAHACLIRRSRFIGALYGRVLGRLLVDLHGGIPTDRFWYWIDPGALALIGSASFFGGVSRLTMSLAVIMVSVAAHSTDQSWETQSVTYVSSFSKMSQFSKTFFIESEHSFVSVATHRKLFLT